MHSPCYGSSFLWSRHSACNSGTGTVHLLCDHSSTITFSLFAHLKPEFRCILNKGRWCQLWESIALFILQMITKGYNTFVNGDLLLESILWADWVIPKIAEYRSASAKEAPRHIQVLPRRPELTLGNFCQWPMTREPRLSCHGHGPRDSHVLGLGLRLLAPVVNNLTRFLHWTLKL